MSARIFLSYTRKDEDKVKELYQKLSDEGFMPWMDTEDILPGENPELVIQKAIQYADFFLACLSSNSVNRRGMLQVEIKEALDSFREYLPQDIYLIPVRLEDCEVPAELKERFQYVNMFEADGFTRLVKAIRVGMERRGEASADGEPPSGTAGATATEKVESESESSQSSPGVSEPQPEADEPESIFLANIGDNDLLLHREKIIKGKGALDPTTQVLLEHANIFNYIDTYKDEDYLKMEKPRQHAELINHELVFGWFKDKLIAPILRPALTEVLSQQNRISHAYLFVTDQTPPKENDTKDYGTVLRKLIKDNQIDGVSSDGIGEIEPRVISDSPANYKEMRGFFSKELSRLHANHPEAETVYVSLSGGTPACSFALLFNALKLWREACIPIYVNKPDPGKPYGKATPLEYLSKDLHLSFIHKSLQTLLNRRQYESVLLMVEGLKLDEGFVLTCEAAKALKAHPTEFDDALRLLVQAQDEVYPARKSGVRNLQREIETMKAGNAVDDNVLDRLHEIVDAEFKGALRRLN